MIRISNICILSMWTHPDVELTWPTFSEKSLSFLHWNFPLISSVLMHHLWSISKEGFLFVQWFVETFGICTRVYIVQELYLGIMWLWSDVLRQIIWVMLIQMVQFQVIHLRLSPYFSFPPPPWATLTILTMKSFLLMSNLSLLSQFKVISLYIPQTDSSATDLTDKYIEIFSFFYFLLLCCRVRLNCSAFKNFASIKKQNIAANFHETLFSDLDLLWWQ